MLSPEYLSGIAEPLQEIYSKLEISISEDIARRIAKTGTVTVTNTAKWNIIKLQEIGASQAYIKQQIAKTLKLSSKEVNTLFKAAGIKSLKTDITTQQFAIEMGVLPADTVPLTASAIFTQVLTANAKRTFNTMKKLTGTIAIDASTKLNQYMDECQLMVQSGSFTERQAIDTTVKKFANDKINTFDYVSGVKTSVEAAVRRACITGVNQATAEISLNNADTLGTDLVEVTSHADARPDHAAWQGKVYSLSGNSKKYQKLSTATGYGTGAGLCGWNCRHSFFAYIEGVSEKLPKEIYDPKTYESEQKQRAIERNIRKYKKRAATLEAGGVDNTSAKAKIKEWQKIQRDHVAKNDLARMYDREKVWGNSVDNKVKSGIIKVNKTTNKAEPNSITDYKTKKGGIDRSFYDDNGKMIKQISNYNHGNAKKHPYGKYGEHAHDIVWDDNNIIDRPVREITEQERKENKDIL